MIVYLESNFVLELVLEQEESSDAEWILAEAEQGKLSVVVPQFAVVEPFSTLSQRSRKRKQLNALITEQQRQLARSPTHQTLVDEVRAVTQKLADLDGHELRKLEQIIKRVLGSAQTVPLTPDVFARAVTYAQAHGLEHADAVVLSSVTTDMDGRESTADKLFVSRNPKDFDVPEIHAELSKRTARLLSSFSVGKAEIERSRAS